MAHWLQALAQGAVFLPAFNPDVWPPSNPSRRGKVATGSARGLKTWLFTVSGKLWHNGLCFNACHSGRLAALKPSPAGYGCHWLQALAQWAVFYRLSIRTFGRPQTLPGRVRLHPSATASAKGLRKLDFTLFRQALAQWAVFLSASNPDVWSPSNVRRRLPLPLLGASKLAFSPFSGRLWHNRLSLTVFNPDVWPPSNPPRQSTVPTSVTTRRCTVFRQVLAQWVFTVFRHALAQALCFNSFQFFDHPAGTLA